MKQLLVIFALVLFGVQGLFGQVVGHYDVAMTQTPFSSGFQPRGLMTTSDGGYLVWGMSTNFPPSAAFVKMGSDMSIGWTRVLADVQNVTGEAVELADRFCFVGYQSSPAYGRLIEINKTSGTLICQRQFEGRILSMDKATDSTVVVCGEIESPSFWTSGYNHFKWDGWLSEVGVYGDTLWTKRVGVMNFADKLTAVQKLPDDGYVVAGDRVPGVIPALPPINNSDTQLAVLDSLGNIETAKQVDFFPVQGSGIASEYVYDLTCVDTMVYAAIWLTGSSASKGAIVAMSTSGSWLKTVAFGHNGISSSLNTYTYGITPGVNGGVLAVGMSKGSGFVTKFDDTLGVEWTKTIPGITHVSKIVHSGYGYVMIGRTTSPHGFRLVFMDESGNIGGSVCGADTLNFGSVMYDAADVVDAPLMIGSYPYEGFSAVSSTNTTTSVSLSDSCLVSIGALPIELVSFGGECAGQDVRLDWMTATEQNTSHFVVERSADSQNFTSVGLVSAAGNSQTTQVYSWLDTDPAELSYYRLRSVDLDGSEGLSDVVAVSCGTDDRGVRIFPNPVLSGRMITIIGSGSFEITDTTGRVVMRTVSDTVRVDLAPGTYFVRGDHERLAVPLVVQ